MILKVIAIVICFALITACGEAVVNNSNNASTIMNDNKSEGRGEYLPADDWKTSTPEKHGMDAELLSEMIKMIEKDEIYSMLIVKDGCIVSEYYKEGWDKGSLCRFNSCTKSITSSLIGIAIDKGYIKGVNQKILDFFPELNKPGIDDRKKQITIQHLLSATSGIDWPEWQEWNYNIAPMFQSTNWVKFILERPMKTEPGREFNYNTGGSHLLSCIIQKTTGKNALSFAKENLFGPLGISSVTWPTDSDNINTGGHGITMTSRDAAKFGLLYLNNGYWNGKQVIPGKWISESTTKQSEGHQWFGNYGYQWWLKSFGSPEPYQTFFAMGYGGQYIFVVPKASMVVVFSSWMPGESCFKPMQYLENFIIKSMRYSVR